MRRGVFRQLQGMAVLLLCTGAILAALAGCQSSPFPIYPEPALVEQGERLYTDRCLACHGNAEGQGRNLDAPPHNIDGHTWHHPDRLLHKWVLDGPPLSKAMPAFRGTLTDQEVTAVLAFIKTMWTDEVRERQTQASKDYEEQVKQYGQ